MDRLEFSKIASETFDTEDILVDLFNELLAVYNLLNTDSVSSFRAEHNEDKSELQFDVEFTDKSEATNASNLLHADCMRLYENKYSLSNEKLGKTRVIIKMQKL